VQINRGNKGKRDCIIDMIKVVTGLARDKSSGFFSKKGIK
jgi:hypothetical protein